MPVDKEHSRFGDGSRRRPLGTVSEWLCPGCGQKVTTQQPEQGCPHCGAGDPTQSTAGLPQAPTPGKADTSQLRQLAEEQTREAHEREVPEAVFARSAREAGSWEGARAPEVVKVYRIIEYAIKRQELVGPTLRNSLVGSLDMAWGSLTACIVDDVSPQQMDRLRMARMQPGVWLANPEAMGQQAMHLMRPDVGRTATRTSNLEAVQHAEEKIKRLLREGPDVTTGDAPPPMPDTGPQWTVEQARIAKAIDEIGGPRLCYTLALALQMVVPEIEGNLEEAKFLSKDDCLALANALMHQVPPDWNPGEETPDGGQT